ncbi:hypothetical protein [Undibacterium sp. TJN19]|uniref:hypothetical protein n=1 Tax=Undibacterium sp. TJN19 TaxID=3413055 RepID=UPI003BF33B1B
MAERKLPQYGRSLLEGLDTDVSFALAIANPGRMHCCHMPANISGIENMASHPPGLPW